MRRSQDIRHRCYLRVLSPSHPRVPSRARVLFRVLDRPRDGVPVVFPAMCQPSAHDTRRESAGLRLASPLLRLWWAISPIRLHGLPMQF